VQVQHDASSEHGFNPITQAENNPFDTWSDAGSFRTTKTHLDPESPRISMFRQDTSESEQLPQSIAREESFGEFAMTVVMYNKKNGDELPGRARLDTGMTKNGVSRSHAEMLGYPIQPYTGDPCVVGDGSLYEPIGQVTMPFYFKDYRCAKTWWLEFIVFPDGAPFDICLGRRFISLADLLKRNPEALPVEFRKLTASKFPVGVKSSRR
jgi:hypothetical protein